MKKVLYYISVAVLFITYGCTTEVDEVFSENASERLSAKMEECMELLTSASNGWEIAYYPEEDQSYGGYTYLASFTEDGDVTVAGEIGDSSERVTSHFSILSSNSAVLSFDTYNSLFHYFSDPDVGSGDSYEGDFEFTYVSGDSSEMIFKGTKTGNTYVFTALDDDVDWTEYLDAIVEMEYTFTASPYIGLIYNGTEEVEFTLDDTYRIFTYSTGAESTATVAFRFTPTGISFYKDMEFDGVTARNFAWSDTNENFVSTDAVSTITLNGTYSDDYVPYDTFLGDWVLSYYNGSRSVNVTIEEDSYGSSYTLTGLRYDLTLGYSKKSGRLSLLTQYVGRYSSYYVYFCPWACAAGYLTWSDTVGFDIIYNGDDEDPILTFEDNGAWVSYEATGFLFYCFTSSTASSSTTAGYLAQYPYLVSLHK